jgi:hypothetical protein
LESDLESPQKSERVCSLFSLLRHCLHSCCTGPVERKAPQKKDKKPAAPGFTKKENATLAQRIEILDWHHAQAKPSQRKTASILPQSTQTFALNNHWSPLG